MQGVIGCFGVDRLEILQNKVRDIANTVTDMSCLEKITVFLDRLSTCMEFQQMRMPPLELPPEFFVEFYPVFLAVLCRSDYWLSSRELLALCRCRKQNVIIMTRNMDTGESQV